MPNIPHTKSAKIVLRVRPSRKGQYVRECRRRGVSLAAFIQAECDRASGYTEDDSEHLAGRSEPTPSTTSFPRQPAL